MQITELCRVFCNPRKNVYSRAAFIGYILLPSAETEKKSRAMLNRVNTTSMISRRYTHHKAQVSMASLHRLQILYAAILSVFLYQMFDT